MAQNIYDNQSFFDGYKKLTRSQEGLAGAPEWPSLRSMVGSVQSTRILDLGCGFGWFVRWAVDNGANKVHGIDISQRMLDKAQKDWPRHQSVTYSQANLDSIEIVHDSHDLIYSSLAFHYISDLNLLFRKIYDGLVSGGRFVFSVEHPIFTAPMKPVWDKESWLMNSYQIEGERKRDWLGETVIKQHRTVSTYIEALLKPGFRLLKLEEWRPTDHDLSKHPDWATEIHRPIFLLISAMKP